MSISIKARVGKQFFLVKENNTESLLPLTTSKSICKFLSCLSKSKGIPLRIEKGCLNKTRGGIVDKLIIRDDKEMSVEVDISSNGEISIKGVSILGFVDTRKSKHITAPLSFLASDCLVSESGISFSEISLMRTSENNPLVKSIKTDSFLSHEGDIVDTKGTERIVVSFLFSLKEKQVLLQHIYTYCDFIEKCYKEVNDVYVRENELLKDNNEKLENLVLYYKDMHSKLLKSFESSSEMKEEKILLLEERIKSLSIKNRIKNFFKSFYGR